MFRRVTRATLISGASIRVYVYIYRSIVSNYKIWPVARSPKYRRPAMRRGRTVAIAATAGNDISATLSAAYGRAIIAGVKKTKTARRSSNLGRYRRNLQGEVDSAELYRALADAEPDTKLKQVYR
ncbi:MAG: hypothetical protein ACREES_12130, partial [Stellaceae bacterium]